MSQPYSAVQYLTGELQRKLAEAREITEKADSEGRQLTDEERGKVETSLTEAASLKTRVTEFNANEELREKIVGLGVVTVESEAKPQSSEAKTWGDAFVNSPQFKALIDRGMQGQWQTEPVQVSRKSGPSPVLELNNGDAIPYQFDPTLRTPGLIQPPLTIADLLPSGTTSLPSIKYPIVKTRNQPSDTSTVEGQPKGGAGFAFDDGTVTLDKLTAFVAVSDEMLSDSPAIAAYINAQLPLMVRQSEEAKLATELYNADSVGPVSGSNVDSSGSPTGFDAIAEAIAVIRLAGLEPDGILIHPLDIAALQGAKTALTYEYYGGSPWTSPPNNPWGLRSVVTASAMQGLPLVGAFARGGQVWRRGGVSVEASNSHEDFFRRDLVAIRAEERVGLAVYYPEAFLTVTLPATDSGV